MAYDTGIAGATNPEKAKFIANTAQQGYKGPSIVDYLNLGGKPSDQASRIAMGKEYGVTGIEGANNAPGNTALLSALRGGTGTTPPSTGTSYTTPSGATVDANGNLLSGGTTPTPAKSDADIAFDTYIQSLQATPEQTAANKRYNDLVTQNKLDYEKALNSGETLGFAQGSAGNFARTAAIMEDAAARGVDTQTGLATTRSTLGKARYDYEQAKLNKEAEANKPFELSPGQERYTYNPKTGKYEKTGGIASTPKTPSYTEQKSMAQTLAQQKISSLMESVRGEDNFVSPPDYKRAKSAWVSDGLSGSVFDSIFGGYVNPTHSKDYGVNFQTKASGNAEVDPALQALLDSLQ